MDVVYWVSLIVGGFFVILSLIGGGDTDAEAEVDFDADADFDFEADADFDADFDAGDADVSVHLDAGGHAPDFVDLFSIRALFLFAAFFGLTGVLLSWSGTAEPLTGLMAGLTGLVVGLGGNYLIKRVGYAHISTEVTSKDLKGRTGTVVLPFEQTEKGKISLVSKGQRLHLVARALDDEAPPFEQGEEVVVVRLDGRVAEVVRLT